MEIIRASETDGPDWDRFAARPSANGHLAHLWGWRSVISEVFGHTPYYLAARTEAGEAAGILPLFHVKGMLFGEALISVPYLNGGGAIGSTEAESALVAYAQSLAAELGVSYLELRNRAPIEGTLAEALQARTHKVSMLLQLQSDPEVLFKNFSAKLRSQIRRPSKDGLDAVVSSGEQAVSEVNDFYSVFATNMRDLGTPVYPKRLFLAAVKTFSSARVIQVLSGGRCVAAGITIAHHSCVEIPWASSLRSFNQYSPNMLLYWAAIKNACAEGFSCFDFGRSSPDSGTYRFKKQWGSEPFPLYWYYPKSSTTIPDISPKNRKFQLLVSCWQHLPVAVANCIGPWLTRSLP